MIDDRKPLPPIQEGFTTTDFGWLVDGLEYLAQQYVPGQATLPGFQDADYGRALELGRSINFAIGHDDGDVLTFSEDDARILQRGIHLLRDNQPQAWLTGRGENFPKWLASDACKRLEECGYVGRMRVGTGHLYYEEPYRPTRRIDGRAASGMDIEDEFHPVGRSRFAG